MFLDINCESSRSCYIFTPQLAYEFDAEVDASLETIEFSWSVEPDFESDSFFNLLRTIPLEAGYL